MVNVIVKRVMAIVPTDVLRLSVVAGNGPPWTIACVTSTPVGKPLIINLPTFCSSNSSKSAYSASSSAEPKTEA